MTHGVAREGLVVDTADDSLLGEATATFDSTRIYRYALTRRWGHGPAVTWVMLNPSTADAFAEDNTSRRVLGFSRALGYAALTITNLYALRSTDPRQVPLHYDPVGPRNDDHIRRAIAFSTAVIVAWGAQSWARPRAAAVAEILTTADRPVHCLGLTAGGSPRHPLYLPRTAVPLPWPAR